MFTCKLLFQVWLVSIAEMTISFPRRDSDVTRCANVAHILLALLWQCGIRTLLNDKSFHLRCKLETGKYASKVFGHTNTFVASDALVVFE